MSHGIDQLQFVQEADYVIVGFRLGGLGCRCPFV